MQHTGEPLSSPALLPTRNATPPSVELAGVSKTFGATAAARDISFGVHAGEIVALVGENGAGKSTCVNLLGGIHRPDTGVVRVGGQPQLFRDPLDARSLGIAVVHQHPALFGELSIAENIYAGRPLRNRFGLLDHAAMRKSAAVVLERLGLRRDPATPVAALRTSEQQIAEIARALIADAKVLVLDEPTAALSTTEVNALFAVVRDLRDSGAAVLFVGHRLDEIFDLSDRLVVLRDGQHVETLETANADRADVVRLMVGRPLSELYPKNDSPPGEPVLSVSNLSTRSGIEDVSLQIRAGEIVGLAGLIGSGRTELARVLFGVDRSLTGTIALCGEPLHLRSPSDALAHGIAYLSEDRSGQGLIGEFSILDNAILPVVDRATRFGLVRRRIAMGLVAGPLSRMRLKYQDFDQPVGTLSGGNQQKVVIAKWLATNPRLLILDEPTQGIDVQAKAEVHRIMSELATSGLAILLISSDLPEVLGMSDRLLVMRRGRIAAEFGRAEANAEDVALAATGALARAASGSAGEQSTVPPTEVNEPRPRMARSSRLLARLGVLARRRECGLLAALVAIVVPISLANPRFLSGANLRSVSGEAALLGVVAAGQLLVVLTRNIDLSVASVIGLSAYLFGSFLKDHPGAPIAAGVLLALTVGLACGLINGLAVGYAKVPAIVATLSTLYVFRGVDSILANGKEIAPGDIPQSLQDEMSRSTLGLSTLVWLCLAVFALLGAVLRWTSVGRQFYQVGSNPDGARLIGVPARRRILAAFAISGTLAGLDGALWAAHYGIIDGQSALGLELTVVAAVVVGGAALRGGYGTVVGVALGTVALFTIQNALQLARVNSTSLQAFYGAAILGAVAIDMLIARRNRRHLAVI